MCVANDVLSAQARRVLFVAEVEEEGVRLDAREVEAECRGDGRGELGSRLVDEIGKVERTR